MADIATTMRLLRDLVQDHGIRQVHRASLNTLGYPAIWIHRSGERDKIAETLTAIGTPKSNSQ